MTRPSIDFRTKRRDEVLALGISQFVEQLAPSLSERHGDVAARAQEALALPPLVLQVDGDTCTIDRGAVRWGAVEGGLPVSLDQGALTDLVAGVRSGYSLVFVGGAELTDGGHARFLGWDHVIRALTDGVPLYEPGSLELRSPRGDELDLQRTFGPDDDDPELAHFLAEAGFARLRGWVDPDLLPPIAAELSDAARRSVPGDPDRWWGTLEDGTERCVRLMRAVDLSPSLAGVTGGEVFGRLGGLFSDGHRLPDHPQSSEALIKPVGVVSGLSEFPWHRDCSMGGHAYDCAGYAVGLPLSRTGGDAGYLRVIPGSHRVSVPPPGTVPSYDAGLPALRLETEPGDLTIHIGCTLHGTRAPERGERIVTYTTFVLPPTDGVGPGDRTDPDLARVAKAVAK